MAYSTASCVALTIVGLFASWLFASLRYYVRLSILKRLNWDDLFAGVALICYTGQSVFYLIGDVDNGLGKHISEHTTPESMSRALKDLFISELFYLFGTAFIKISFALTLYRVVIDRFHIYTLYMALSCTIIMSIVAIIFIILTCKPVSFFWESVLNPFGGTCLGEDVQMKISYAHAAVMLFVDIILGLVLPVLVISGLQMQNRVKISAIFLLSLGSSAVVATTARLVYSSRDRGGDFLYSVNVPFLWAGIELASSIVGTSAATLKPLLVAMKVFKGSIIGKRGNQYDLEGNKIGWPSGRAKVVISGPDRAQKSNSRATSSSEELSWDGRITTGIGVQKTLHFETSTRSDSGQEW